jgi:uncharacterized protein YgfB (UPF0149 family)
MGEPDKGAALALIRDLRGIIQTEVTRLEDEREEVEEKCEEVMGS